MDFIDLAGNAQTIIPILSFFGALASILAVSLPVLNRSQFASRLKSVSARRKELSQKQKEAFAKRGRFEVKRHVGLMRTVLNRLNLQKAAEDKGLKQKLAQAGWRRQSAGVTFVFSRVAAPILFVVIALLYLSSPNLDFALTIDLLICAGAGIVGYLLPNILLTNAIQKRQKAITRGFPDALDLMVICVDAGLSVEAAFQRVTEELADTNPEMAEEIGLTGAELAFLGDRRIALDNFALRTGLPSVKSLATALIQSEKYGTPVSQSLRVIAQENRDSRMSAAEKKAAALPAKLTVPMIVFFLPVLFIVILGPAIMQISASGVF